MTARPTLGVVVLAYGDEPWLAECVDSVLASHGVEVDLVVVDNGCRAADLEPVAKRDDLEVLRPGTNTGFAGGCNLGARHVRGEYLALVNSDCLVEPETLAALAAVARDPAVGPVMASIRFADRPGILNSGGNPVHVLGTCWAGGIEEPETRRAPYDVASASGACLLLRREVWDRVEGFDEEYFAYLEDTELSLRCRRLGLAARCVPTAVALHHYEFSRNPRKMYLLERNRLLMVATLWSPRALVLLAPFFLALEAALLVLATVQGWGREKVRGWRWVLGHRDHLRRRRRLLAAERTVPEREWLTVLTPELAPHVVGSAAAARAVNVVLGGYWRLVRRLV
ncbi:glycosyltransferase family 2 protein [Actinomycetospora sp. TBRC 11914]|uniref:glycosyltransferase family 2 protein n=1 Tax=Actinomycetospora sp. TBRC 11914 TaxID=2729387 RepID=UPI00145D3186|nr:glycosyltransferase family 2 protein [Actinomycetospora sp. TBRC 11914]NMO90075.1 glycosyltransferase family 2 protein [Actinomycetospora sp. TBRC 11914]